ncbi:MAG: hypothetical protein MUE37_11485, partial [Bacteroidales bacterium]|nr:hypothetical protein [Bacteroidales bacterium]
MRVFKFGGASVKDAEGIINLYDIVSEETDRLVVVVSALGKTTNALEKLHDAWRERKSEVSSLPGGVPDYHAIPGGISGYHAIPGGISGYNAIPDEISGYNVIPGGISGYNAILGGISGYHAILGGISGYHLLIAEQLFGQGAPEYQKVKSIF